MIEHNSNDVFQLSKTGWEEAIKKYSDLNRHSVSLNFFQRSTNAWIQPKNDNYFDNSTIFAQFGRLFELIKFKKNATSQTS